MSKQKTAIAAVQQPAPAVQAAGQAAAQAAATTPHPTQGVDLIPPKRDAITVPPFGELTKVIFGEPKSGKTTFCAGDKGAMFLATEPGQDFVQNSLLYLDDDLLGRLGCKHHWEGFQAFVRQIYKGKHDGTLAAKGVKAVVIDIVDGLYAHCLNYICRQKNIAYPPENDFGKTWKEIRDEWETWLRRLISQVNVTVISHCNSEKVELVQGNGMVKEVTRWQPTFKGNKAAQYLDGVVNCIGHVRKDAQGQYTITFKGAPTTAAGDRTGLLERVGEQPLNWAKVEQAYNDAAKAAGLEVRSRWL